MTVGSSPAEGEMHMADVAVGALPGAASPGAASGAGAGDLAPPQVPDDASAEGGAESAVQSQVPRQSGETNVTQAQLRRFIKSRPYVPMHELRRRFELNGATDDVSPIKVADGIVYLGLPDRESQFIAELVRQGEVGVELCHDPPVPIVVGVFPMRPIAR